MAKRSAKKRQSRKPRRSIHVLDDPERRQMLLSVLNVREVRETLGRLYKTTERPNMSDEQVQEVIEDKVNVELKLRLIFAIFGIPVPTRVDTIVLTFSDVDSWFPRIDLQTSSNSGQLT